MTYDSAAVAAKQRGRIFGRPRARRGTIASANEREEITMKGKKAFVALAISTALSFLSCASAVAKDDMGDMGDRADRGGSVVVRCSLSGVNPAVHPEIFGNPAVAASYGFVRSRDGTWHVQHNCHR